jgi:hypothetical protein
MQQGFKSIEVDKYICIFILKGQSKGQESQFPSPRARKKIIPVGKM